MKIAVVNKLCLAAWLALGAVAASLAAPPQGGRPMSGAQGEFRQRGGEFNAQDHRNQMAAEQEQRRAGKLSPDERRELRRQINEAGQDIYRVKR
ncbi:hypothetical protein Herbaro_10320 [Herbaspirillum sp. WKF16]|uniref:hypothetical protein n=1 Tax=Herbaspirillum sp. WKF16 TaxID=3028312 RepID=UPI0023A97AFB|nr:hypothetical protein [Herbaspirillum sp. WKF16]WDZ98153.1 hypothetical protein Herbaro_10320 [Herbaspirillum sp. WKF16]